MARCTALRTDAGVSSYKAMRTSGCAKAYSWVVFPDGSTSLLTVSQCMATRAWSTDDSKSSSRSN
jgi:hypothetical protein